MTLSDRIPRDETTGEPLILQVPYRDSMWRVAVVCTLLCSTSRERVGPLLEPLFERWPTSLALSLADVDELARFLRPTGLQAHKASILRRLSRDEQERPTDPWSWFGVGPYAYDAIRCLCWEADLHSPACDVAIELWRDWRHRQLLADPSEDGSAALAASP